ncbi:MAG: TfoX/Sxy family protein [candidate division WOR-3 bacterium]|nr:TfoX/Sxy family protein [candidate division WOR-3 bacterium]
MNEKRKADPAKKWGPASDEWTRVYIKIAAGIGDQRRMFGYPCAFVNGNMFAGLFQTGLFLRLSEPEREKFLRLKGASRFEPMPGRPMREYVTAPAGMARHPEVVAEWLRRACAYASSLPRKEKRPRQPR